MSQPKKWVKERYGAIAANARSSCCDGAASATGGIGYTPDDLASVPRGANLGLGCGNPTALATIKPGETVLDLGSGAGFDAFLAAARVGPTGRVIGVDLTPEMIAKAQENAAAGGTTNVEFRLGDIETLPVDDASIDLVISNCVLNLVPDKPTAFREIVRVLKPGGRVAISDIVLEGPLPKSLEADEGGYCSCISGAMGRAEYLAELSAAGIADLQVVSAVDAAPILASDCCGDGLTESDLTGLVTSISLLGRKPVPPSDSDPSGAAS
ncbi:MAG TPA: arsenite methyltransferase [Armatimonadota bacterium]|nr:arsenite methyltransferase [Armatimonadota bacterium]